jgi:hypothetical protein
MPRSRVHGAIPPLSNTPSWRGAQLKKAQGVYEGCSFRDSSVGIATGYGLNDRMVGVRFQAGAGYFSLRHCVQTCSGSHPDSCLKNTGSGRDVKLTIHLHLVLRLKNAWSYISIPAIRDHSKGLGVHGMIILEWILEKVGVKMWTRFIWLRIGTSSVIF